MDQSSTPLVTIITVNYNQAAVTYELLDSIRRNSYSNTEVIVVDNGSRENPGPYIQEHYPEVWFIRSDENLGFSGGNNLGIIRATGSYVFLINNDAELTDGAIESMLALFEEVPRLGAVSPMLCYYNDHPKDQPDIIQYVGTTPVHSITARNKTLGELEPDRGQYTTPKPTAYAHGAAMMVPISVVREVGMMPEEFFLYYEELDWSAQIRRAGYEIYVQPNAKIIHKESISVGKTSTLKTFYLNRNRILFMRRNKSTAQLLGFTLFLLGFTIPKNTIKFILKGEWDHLKVFYRAITWHLFNSAEIKKVEPTVRTVESAL